MTISQYFILGWIGCGIFILFALIWLFGLITSQPRLRFVCDFFMVGALFIMLIGFGARHKQIVIQEKRQAAIALKQKNYQQTGEKFRQNSTGIAKSIDEAASSVTTAWQDALKANQQKKKGKSKKSPVSPSKAVSQAFKDEKSKLAKSKKKLLKQADLLALLKQYQYKNAKVKYASYQAVQKTELAYYNAVVSINGLTLAQYKKQVSRAKDKYDQAASELSTR
ncbi:hypothetical protein [Lactobacillus sp.]|uniref:hypothetical protein n=1 Tax=Lactobacillus sp. TaxID=1591 RepID=UPI003F070A94